MNRRISDVKPICLFAFYGNNAVVAVPSSETTEPKMTNFDVLVLERCVRRHSDFRGDTSEIGALLVGAQFGNVLENRGNAQPEYLNVGILAFQGGEDVNRYGFAESRTLYLRFYTLGMACFEVPSGSLVAGAGALRTRLRRRYQTTGTTRRSPLCP